MKREGENLDEERYRSLLRWRDRWTALVFALGLAATVFLIAAILLFIQESWIPGAVSTIVSILSGGAVRWLLARRKEAVSEEQQAFEERTNAAKARQERDRKQQSRDALVGRKSSSNE